MSPIKINTELPTLPDYQRYLVKCAFWQASYKVGPDYKRTVDADGQAVLVKFHPGENSQSYQRRMDLGYADPYVAQVVDQYVSFMFRYKAKRPDNKPDWYTELLESVNSDGTTYDTVLQEISKNALIEKYAFAWIDVQDDKPVITSLKGCEVPWFKVVNGNVREAIVVTEREDKPVAIYFNDKQQIIYSLGKEDEKATWFTVQNEIETIDHSYGRCPIIMFCPELNMVEHISEAQKKIFNYLSQMDQSIIDTCYAQFVVTGVDDSRLADIKRGTDHMLVLPQGAAASFVSPAVNVITTVNEISKTFSVRIMQYAGIGTSEANSAESGLAKAFKFQEINARISKLLVKLSAFDNMITDTVAAGIGEEEPDDTVYPDDISETDLSTSLAETISIMASSLPETIKQLEVSKLMMERYGKDTDKTEVTAV